MTADQSETTADTGSESDSDESEWAFQPDEAIRQEHTKHSNDQPKSGCRFSEVAVYRV